MYLVYYEDVSCCFVLADQIDSVQLLSLKLVRFIFHLILVILYLSFIFYLLFLVV